MNLDESNIVAFLGNIFDRRGAEIYLDEKVSMAEHMLQGAALVEASSSSDELITAILLHDVGHFTSEFGAYSPDDTQDKYRDITGGHILKPFSLHGFLNVCDCMWRLSVICVP